MNGGAVGRPPPRRLALLILGGLGYLATMFVWFILPAFLTPIIRQFGLTGTQAGVLAGAVPLTYIPLGLLSGALIDRIGSRVGVGVGLLIVGGAGLARATVPGFWPMLGTTLLLGVGATGITFGLPKLVSDLFEPERVGTLSSVYVIGSYLGVAAAFGIGRPVLGPLLGGWRPAFVLTGAATVGLGLAWFLVTPRLDRDGRTLGDTSGAFSLTTVRRDVVRVARNRNVRLLVLIGTMYLLLLHGLQGWLATLLEGRGLSAATAAGLTSLLVIAQIVGTLTLPTLADRWRRRRATVAAGGALAATGMVGLVATATPLLAGLAVVVIGVGLGGLSPLVRSLPVEMDGVGPELTATAVGLVFAVGEIGGFAGPFLVGLLRDRSGSFLPGLTLLAVAGLVIVAASAALRDIDAPTGRSDERPERGTTPD